MASPKSWTASAKIAPEKNNVPKINSMREKLRFNIKIMVTFLLAGIIFSFCYTGNMYSRILYSII